MGIVCGSGLGQIANDIVDPLTIRYEDIPGFPHSSVKGHKNELVFGNLGGKYVACMKGRFHFYEGYDPKDVAIPPRIFSALGAKLMIVTNAAGGLNQSFNVGDVMMITDHIYFTGLAGVNPLIGHNDDRFGDRFTALNGLYPKDLYSIFEEIVENKEVDWNRELRKGTYMGVAGPCYETPHEVKFLNSIGGDTVGMSTLPEVCVGAQSDMQVIGLSLVTNVGIMPDSNITAPHHQEVVDNAKAAEVEIQSLVTCFLRKLSTDHLKVPRAYAHFEKLMQASNGAAGYMKTHPPQSSSSSSSCSSASTGNGKCLRSTLATVLVSVLASAVTTFTMHKILSRKR